VSVHEWIALATFLVVQSFIIGVAWENLRGRVKAVEVAMPRLEEAMATLAESTARVDAVRREDDKILSDIEATRKEMREGFAYFGECLGQVTIATNAHESWLSNMEKRVVGADGSRPRVPAVRPPPKPPEWLSPRAQVPPLHVAKADPRREKP
jgi:hypothetical protein